MSGRSLRIVWFKRDLRVFDHAPLVVAADAAQREGSAVLPLYVIEPGLWRQPDASLRQWRFVRESLLDLDDALRALGAALWVAWGEAPDVFARLGALATLGRPVLGVHAHEETGNAWTFARDRAVARTLRVQGVPWLESPVPGVQRARRERRGWAGRWEAAMRAPLIAPPPPAALAVPDDVRDDVGRALGFRCRRPVAGAAENEGQGGGPCWLSRDQWAGIDPPGHAAFEVADWAGHRAAGHPGVARGVWPESADDVWRPQPGGRRAGIAVLESFLIGVGSADDREARRTGPRIGRYLAGLSRPERSYAACSRLSPYLSWGCLSLREVVQAHRRQAQLAGLPWRPGAMQTWPDAARTADAQPDLFAADTRAAPRCHDPNDPIQRARQHAAFDERLHWRSHFVQKLESDPSIEVHNLQRAIDGLREDAFDEARFEAWCAGRTGYPLVDACMRALRQTGWLNFRMRAMLVSFAAYNLWLHWQRPAWFLARLFTDYEPGIHYSQMQMQSGTTGINALRIYDPVKQSFEQDPDGAFIRRFVPELRALAAPAIHTPWAAPDALARAGIVLGRDYPHRIVDHVATARAARRAIEARRREAGARREAQAVFERHGSRRPKALRSWGPERA